jgi:hypothetical protein
MYQSSNASDAWVGVLAGEEQSAGGDGLGFEAGAYTRPLLSST